MGEQTRRKLLLIDDDTSLLVTLRDFLEFEGYDVVTADSGEKGLEMLGTMKPDLIVLDMSMPGMSGVGFLKAISSADGKPAHPVLVLTARANMAEFFANVDVDGFVAKPCDPSDLLMELGVADARYGTLTPAQWACVGMLVLGVALFWRAMQTAGSPEAIRPPAPPPGRQTPSGK